MRGTIHLESVKLVELFVLGRFPDFPIVEGTKLATSETGKGTFSEGQRFGLDGIDKEVNFVGSDICAIHGGGGA